jgi:tRNA 5-methylaminomethyl-2-thiouridine biosynthesis bifunctional protein
MHVVVMKVTPTDSTEYFRPMPRAAIDGSAIDLDPCFSLDAEGQPFSKRFNKRYHHSSSINDMKHIFFNESLRDIWNTKEKLHVIGEMGFATGLNFVIACNLWKKHGAPGSSLHYLAIERYPLEAEQIDRSLSGFRQLDVERKELLAVYPKPHVGFHRVWIGSRQLSLTLIIGPVLASLSEIEARVDTWLFNGVSAKENSEMWSQESFNELARLSKPEAKFSSIFNDKEASSRLMHSGFEIFSDASCRNQTTLLRGKFNGSKKQSRLAPWFRFSEPKDNNETIGVLGAGIAGCAVAQALARRGKNVRLFDQHNRVALGASGVNAGLITPQIGLSASNMNRFYDRAYRMTLASVEKSQIDWSSRGSLQLYPEDEANRRVQFMKDRANLWPGSAVVVSPQEASLKTGIKITSHGVWFPDAGALSPSNYAKAMSIKAETIFGKAVGNLTYGEKGWKIFDLSGNLMSSLDTLVITAAQSSNLFEPTSFLPLSSLLGQISLMPSNKKSAQLKATIINNGYLMPSFNDYHLLGSTYVRHGFDENIWPQPVTVEGHKNNHEKLMPQIKSYFSDPQYENWSGYAAVRSATPDRLPVVGPVPRVERFNTDFHQLRHGPRGRFPVSVDHHPGLFVLAGLGSRGIMTAAISAEVLVSQMLGEPWPIERTVAVALSPARFLARSLQEVG